MKDKLKDYSALSPKTNNRFEVLTSLNETLKLIESVKGKIPKSSKLLCIYSNREKDTHLRWKK
jgi:hypothetical protein